MTNALRAAVGALNVTLKTGFADTIRYRRDADFVDVAAVPARTPVGTILDVSIQQTWHAHDWLIQDTDLVLSGDVITPEVGDTIEVTVGEDVRLYKVVNADDGRCFVRHPIGGRLRIHTKEIPADV